MTQGHASRATGPALEAMYQLMRWLIPTLEKVPRSQKFLLGDRIQTAALDVLERLIEATFRRERRKMLAEANLGLLQLRILCRLALDLQYLDHRRCEHAAREIDLVGGGVKADGKQNGAKRGSAT